MVKIYCDFCEVEIPESTPKVSGEVFLGLGAAAANIAVEIKLGSTEPRKRFGHDICTECVYRAVAKMNPYQVSAEAASGF